MQSGNHKKKLKKKKLTLAGTGLLGLAQTLFIRFGQKLFRLARIEVVDRRMGNGAAALAHCSIIEFKRREKKETQMVIKRTQKSTRQCIYFSLFDRIKEKLRFIEVKKF